MFAQLMPGAVRELKIPIHNISDLVRRSNNGTLSCRLKMATSFKVTPNQSPIALTRVSASVNPAISHLMALRLSPQYYHFFSMISSSVKLNSWLINYIERGHCHCHSAKKYKSRTYPRCSLA